MTEHITGGALSGGPITRETSFYQQRADSLDNRFYLSSGTSSVRPTISFTASNLSSDMEST
jgi:hypothetical protein